MQVPESKVTGRWIGRGGQTNWSPRSSDLNSLDFYLWGHLKSVYSSPVNDEETLRNPTVAGFQTIRNMPGIWDHFWVAMRHRAVASIQAGGGNMNIYCKVM
jgi:hypothetical protein